MRVYAIRLKGTDKYLPHKNGAHSYTEVSDARPPRFLPTKRGAINALVSWLQGYWSFSGSQRYEKVPDRKRENMEIVEFELVELKTYQLANPEIKAARAPRPFSN